MSTSTDNPAIAAYPIQRTALATLGATATVRFGGAEYVGIRGTPRDSRDVGAPGRGSMDARNMTVRLLATELKGDAPKAGDQIDLMGARSTWEPRAVVDVQHATDAATVLLTLGGQYA
jgi:hypothetical protein